MGRLDPMIEAVLDFDINDVRMYCWQGSAAHAMGVIFLNIDDARMDVADVWIKKAIEKDGHYRMPWYLAKDYALYAEFFRKKGDLSQAKEKLQTAIAIFRECGADGWVKKYDEELIRL